MTEERKTVPLHAGFTTSFKDAAKPGPGTSKPSLAREDLTADELDALQAIDDAVAQGLPTSKVVNVSQRTLDHGLLKKNEKGELELTVVGKRMLRPA
ncbi:hypothetical protein J7E70_01915 [Variovorax paradoxus]|nr:hypothetical protein [Variovorax paradoxus]MBT2299211.1 hypothetical protein [Variovorax paradoxus]